MRSTLLCLVLCVLATVSAFAQNTPNIVLILVDDAGLMDFGAYGGEARTPNIDKLTKNGTMFTNMHASPVCAPSRGMLITGSNNHVAEVANLPEMLPEEYREKEGYEGELNDKVQTIATRLNELDYNNYVAGKWHLGHNDKTLPVYRGFDRSFVLGGSGADNYSDNGYLPFKSKGKWYKDGKKTHLPEDFYSSEFYVDQIIQFHKEETNADKPFFTYLAFQAVHTPVQAPREFTDNYLETYKQGWDVLRQQRFEKAKELGIVPQNAKMNPTLEGIPKWDDLKAEEQAEYATHMAMMAGMIEAMDFHIGRYIQFLEEKGLAENTVFIVASDNGPDGGDYSPIRRWTKRQGYHYDYDEKGGDRYFGYIGPGYASAIAAPFSYFKYYTGEGGLRVSLIISGKGLPKGKKDGELCFITDIAPTIYDIVGLSPAAKEGFAPLAGKSILPHIEDNSKPIYEEDEGFGVEAAGCSAYFLGDYKITMNNAPYGDFKWRLYNLKKDPCETTDLSSEEPLVFQTLLARYEAFAKEVVVVAMPQSYNAQKEVAKKSKKALINPFK